jgi:hypothetical protein
VRNGRHEVNDSPRILHSSPAEEKKLEFPFSENGPSNIQGEAATAPFSDLGEWSESAMTTPNVNLCASSPEEWGKKHEGGAKGEEGKGKPQYYEMSVQDYYKMKRGSLRGRGNMECCATR